MDSNTNISYNVYGLSLISKQENSDKVYYVYNGHGDVTGIFDASGVGIKTYYYDAWGNIEEETGSFKNNFTYLGYLYDSEVGLYDLKARFYDAKVARFMQADTYLGNQGDPLSLNLYTYCHNDPIKYFDPTGHGIFDVLAGVATAVVTTVAKTVASSSSGQSNNSNVDDTKPPEWMDWNGDGKIDTKEERDSFDKNGDRIADWLQDGSGTPPNNKTDDKLYVMTENGLVAIPSGSAVYIITGDGTVVKSTLHIIDDAIFAGGKTSGIDSNYKEIPYKNNDDVTLSVTVMIGSILPTKDTKKVNYILFDPHKYYEKVNGVEKNLDSGWDYAYAMQKVLENETGNPTFLIPVSSAQQFEAAWNFMGENGKYEIGIVVLDFHANDKVLSFSNTPSYQNKNLTITNVSNLNGKPIGGLFLTGCLAAHSMVENNIAKAFWDMKDKQGNRYIRNMIASDGTTVSLLPYNNVETFFESIGDKTWYIRVGLDLPKEMAPDNKDKVDYLTQHNKGFLWFNRDLYPSGTSLGYKLTFTKIVTILK